MIPEANPAPEQSSPEYRPGGLSAPMSADGMRVLQAGREGAVQQASERFYAQYGKAYESFGDSGRNARHEDLAFHLDFMETALESGVPEPFLAYLLWLRSVRLSRGAPWDHLGVSLQLLVDALSPALGKQDRQTLQALVNAGTQALARTDTALAGAAEPASATASTTTGDMCDALLRGDHSAALGLLQADIDSPVPYSDAQVRLVQSAMYEVGARWQHNRVSIAQEHLATATAQTVITQSLMSQAAAPTRHEKIILACVEGNHHALGLRMVADGFELAGWTVIYLGANAAERVLCETALDRRPDVIGLSVALPHHLRAARRAIAAIRAALGKDCPRILLGGLAVNTFPGIAGALGADATLRDASQCSAYANATAA